MGPHTTARSRGSSPCSSANSRTSSQANITSIINSNTPDASREVVNTSDERTVATDLRSNSSSSSKDSHGGTSNDCCYLKDCSGNEKQASRTSKNIRGSSENIRGSSASKNIEASSIEGPAATAGPRSRSSSGSSDDVIVISPPSIKRSPRSPLAAERAYRRSGRRRRSSSSNSNRSISGKGRSNRPVGRPKHALTRRLHGWESSSNTSRSSRRTSSSRSIGGREEDSRGTHYRRHQYRGNTSIRAHFNKEALGPSLQHLYAEPQLRVLVAAFTGQFIRYRVCCPRWLPPVCFRFLYLLFLHLPLGAVHRFIATGGRAGAAEALEVGLMTGTRLMLLLLVMVLTSCEEFAVRSPSPQRRRAKGEMWDTRLGQWKSRAGGVYIPPTPEELQAAEGQQRALREQHQHARSTSALSGGLSPRRQRSPSLRVRRERGSPVYE
ncbi:hypothetical protein, conserved [Eimeria acervulina]|uniref:Uncharacterized protein n=1 Tax=Eimeria acervulina TaxID=5801 RepID=U6GIM2_EIMAC|nr:hypothetical protein, conserved [Eimeria acervulina]CDI80086.1 hypothetical protein, conserved [Eimeria acervulina]